MMKAARVGWGYAVLTVLVSACSQLAPPQTPPQALATSVASIETYASSEPTETAINEIEMLQEQVKLLEQNVFLLQEQVKRLTKQQVGMNQSIGVIAKSQGIRANQPAIDTSVLKHNSHVYSTAYQQYQQKKYQQAIQTLRPYASGGDGSPDASNGMYLLMLAHKQLKQCESTITIGRQFQQRFPTHSRAAEALYSVGQCQYDMQQKDIARETWKRVRILYPHSAAARMAAQHLK